VLPEKVPSGEPSARFRLRRSRLYLPGNDPKYLINAALHQSDAIILDLEDSVHPDEKDAARLLVRNALRAVDFRPCERMVRINKFPLGMEDLEEIIPESPDLILIPKTESARHVLDVSEKIAAVKADFGITRPIWLMPIIESALGVEKAFEIATANEEVVALTIGLEDYAADLGVAKTIHGAESLFARQRVINAARAAGIQAIDSVFGDINDMETLRAWALNSRAIGFEGMGCIHPLQIEVVHQAFAPTATEIEDAHKIVDAYRKAQAQGIGVVSLGSKMIDAPVLQRALKIVAQAELLGCQRK
jgi:citrate lyase subunit beta/citryl-CoA lyase